MFLPFEVSLKNFASVTKIWPSAHTHRYFLIRYNLQGVPYFLSCRLVEATSANWAWIIANPVGSKHVRFFCTA